jgi:Leu/Phe-tRNA-protein transferase
VLLVDTNENASHVLLALLVEENELERDPGEELLDQPIDMGELNAFGDAMMDNKEYIQVFK